MMIPGSCPKCHGAMERQQNNDCGLAKVFEWHCFNCGNVISSERMQNIIYEKNYKVMAVKNMPESMPSQARKINKEEETMVTQPVIPVKLPDTSGLNYPQKGKLLRKFHEEHKQEIIEDIERLGKESTRKRWQIPSQTFLNLRRDWGMPIDGTHAHNTKHQGDVQKSTENVQIDSDCHVSPVDGESRKDEPASTTEPLTTISTKYIFPECRTCNLWNYTVDGCPLEFCQHGYKKPKFIKPPVTKPNLPDYPPFDAAWKEDVQREWIRVYGLMTVGGKIA